MTTDSFSSKREWDFGRTYMETYCTICRSSSTPNSKEQPSINFRTVPKASDNIISPRMHKMSLPLYPTDRASTAWYHEHSHELDDAWSGRRHKHEKPLKILVRFDSNIFQRSKPRRTPRKYEEEHICPLVPVPWLRSGRKRKHRYERERPGKRLRRELKALLG